MSKSMSATLFILAAVGLMVAGCGGGGGGGGSATHAISGSVMSGGSGLSGTSVTLSGADNQTAVTDSNGRYTFEGLSNGAYTVTPIRSGYVGSPRARTCNVNGADVSADFTVAAASPICYVVDEVGTLGTVNVQTGAVEVLGTSAVVMTDIAFDASGNLYGVSVDKLYRVNKIDGAATPLPSDLGINNATALVFSNNGDKLYTADSFLYTVSTTTGAITTTVGNGDFISSGDLTFIGSTLYMTGKNLSNLADTYFIRLDPATGKGTLIGNVGFPYVFGLASNDNVTLYGFSGTKLITINTGTGAGTLVKDLSGQGLTNINGAAFE